MDLSQHVGERFIARSQAKQVYQREAPHIVIHYIHANASVDYMIKRCLATQNKV